MVSLLFIVEGRVSRFLRQISIVNRRVCVFSKGKVWLVIRENVVLNNQVLHMTAINGKALLARCVVCKCVVHDTCRNTVHSLLLICQEVGYLHGPISSRCVHVRSAAEVPRIFWINIVTCNCDCASVMRLSYGCIIVKLVRAYVKSTTALLILLSFRFPNTGASQVDRVSRGVSRVAPEIVLVDQYNRPFACIWSLRLVCIICLHVGAVHEDCATKNAKVIGKSAVADNHRPFRLGNIKQGLPLHLQQKLVGMVFERR